MVQFRFADPKLGRLCAEPNYAAGYGPNIVKAFRKAVGFIQSAADERDFHAMKSLHYEKLKGNRSHQRPMRLNQQFRLILEIHTVNGKTVVIVGIEKHYE